MLRFASPADGPTLLAIYGQYIDTPITFEYTLPTPADFRGRIEDIAADYPYLVWEEGGAILGYAYAHRHMERAAYQWNAELSVYLAESARGRGLGARLYTAVMDILRLQGVRNAYACVTLPNPRSEALHRSLGFTPIGVWRSAGYKNGRWRDTCWYEKALAPYDENPAPFRSVRTLPPAAVERVLGAKSPCFEGGKK